MLKNISGISNDSDLLDGKEGSYYLPSTSYNASDVLTKLKTVDSDSSGLNSNTLQGLDSTRFSRSAISTFTGGDWNTLTDHGVYKIQHDNFNSDKNNPPADYPYGILISEVSELSSEHRKQQTYYPHSNNDKFIYHRMYNNGGWTTWSKIWRGGIGPNSGLDADLLDGQHGSYYAPIANAQLTGKVNINGRPSNSDYCNSSYIDLTSLDPNTYYPVRLSSSNTEWHKYIIYSNLTTGKTADWMTHSGGFTLNLRFDIEGCGWGTNIATCIVETAENGFGDSCGGIVHLRNSSGIFVHLRGGAKYTYSTTSSQSPTIYTTTYSMNNESVGTIDVTTAKNRWNELMKSTLRTVVHMDNNESPVFNTVTANNIIPSTKLVVPSATPSSPVIGQIWISN